MIREGGQAILVRTWILAVFDVNGMLCIMYGYATVKTHVEWVYPPLLPGCYPLGFGRP